MSEVSPQSAPAAGKRRRILALLGGLFLLAGVCVAAWWLLVACYRATTDNAYVAGNVVQITPQVAGTVTAVHAEDTDLVASGQLLVELDDADARIGLQSAEAALADAVRSVRGLYAGVGQSGAMVAQRTADIERLRQEAARADAELRRARDDLTRKESLYRDKFISPDALQVARTALQAAEATRAAAQASVIEATSALAGAREQKLGADVLVDNTSLESHPRVAAAAAKVKDAFLAQQRTRIVAPVGGHVARRKVQLGERVASGAPLMTVIPADQLWVDANFKETDLADVRIGQPVTLSADFWGRSVEYHGKVAGLASGTGAAFAVLPAQNASGNWIKIVQRVPVRISLEPTEIASHPLRIGLSMRASIDTHDQSGAVLAAKPRPEGGLATDVFARQSREADALIASVIAANRAGGKP